MSFIDYITVFNNISKNFYFLKSDFTGVRFTIIGFSHFIVIVLISAFFILVYYLIGDKIRLILLKGNKYDVFDRFINIALGYILANSILAFLGVFSLFYPLVLWIYIIIILLVAFYPYSSLGNFRSLLFKVFTLLQKKILIRKWIFLGVFLFVFIAFLRLIPPEIGEDAIGYHTSDPHLFLKNHTTMIYPRSSSVSMLTPHLGEMSYLISEFIGIKDLSRYIHFSFYFILTLLLLLKYPYGALFFVTAPVVIQVSSKANVDFQWIFCWVLTILLITRSRFLNRKNVILVGILFGGVLASKIWTIAFFPLFIIYLFVIHRKLNFSRRINIIFTFSLFVLLVDAIWLMRSFILSGSPVYPVFSSITSVGHKSGTLNVGDIIGFNSLMFHIKNLIVFSPLFFLGTIFLFLNWRSTFKILRKSVFFLFFIILISEYFFVKYHFGRYLLGLYSFVVVFVSSNINYLTKKFAFYRISFVLGFTIMFIYYFLNALLILPYGFGWADENKYLTRILSRDNSSYYDFDKRFNLQISKKDKVATYETFGFYYANFEYTDVNYIFDKDKKSLEQLQKQGITKLFIKGGSIEWFCERLKIKDCYSFNYKLIAQHSPDPKYLYSLGEKKL